MHYNSDPIIPEAMEDEIPFPVCTQSIPQVVYGKWGEPLNFSPRNIAFSTSRNYDSSIFVRIDNLIEYISNFRKISIMRTYALGDVIMCIPLMRYLRRKFPEKQLTLYTISDFHNIFCNETEFGIGSINRSQSRACDGDEILINLDFNTFELDHSKTHPYNKLHRTDILYSLFSVPAEDRVYDYSIDLQEMDIIYVKQIIQSWGLGEDKYLFWSWRGSNPIKTFPIHIREYLIRHVAEHIPIVVSDWEGHPEGRFEHPNVKWFTGQSLTRAVTCVGLSKCCVTTDSAILWFAHQTSVPTLCFLGPTLEEQRLVHHPLYPERCRKVELKPLVGCPEACQHTLNWCMDKSPQVTCFASVSQELLLAKVFEQLREMKII